MKREKGKELVLLTYLQIVNLLKLYNILTHSRLLIQHYLHFKNSPNDKLILTG